MECSVFGCIRGSFKAGLCGFHYEQQRREKAGNCSEEGCKALASRKGLCASHYRKQLNASAPRCKIEGCGRAAVSKGLCDTHRLRLQRRGTLDWTRPADWGSKSNHPLKDRWHQIRRYKGKYGVDPRWDDFWEFVKDVGESPSPRHRLIVKDKNAQRNKDNVEWRPMSVIGSKTKAEYQREWRIKNPRAAASHEMKKRYGITIDEYERLFSQQNGLCAICGAQEIAVHKRTDAPRKMAVDHCHATGKVRGLLCTRCNSLLGSAQDREEILLKAIEYLRRYK